VFAPHGVYPARDEDGMARFVAVAVRTDDEWHRLAGVLGLVDRPDLATAEGRRAAADELDDVLASWTRDRPAADVETELQGLGVPAHVAATSADFVADPQLVHRGHVVALDDERHGTAYVEGPRYLLSETPGRVTRSAPTLGRDNETVLREVLGYSDDRIRALEEGSVLR
jgi:benzylsuccinate CoA-transferase BbsF subunit